MLAFLIRNLIRFLFISMLIFACATSAETTSKFTDEQNVRLVSECAKLPGDDDTPYIGLGVEAAIGCYRKSLVSWGVVQSMIEQRLNSVEEGDKHAIRDFEFKIFDYVTHSTTPIYAEVAAMQLEDSRILTKDSDGRYHMLLAVVYLNSDCSENKQKIVRLLDQSYALGSIAGAALRVYLYANPYGCFEKDLLKGDQHYSQYQDLADGKVDYSKLIETMKSEELISR